MYLEHGHVEYDRNENEAESAGIKVFDPELWWNTQVSEQRPQLPDSLEADGSNGEEAHHLQLTTAPRDRPVRVSQLHQRFVKGACLSSLQNPVQRKIVSAVKNTSGESRRICLDWVRRAFSKIRKSEARRAVVARQSRPRRVR